MFSLLLSLVVLLVGFLVYGRLTERIFSPDDRTTPAVAMNDGVDCVPMKPWKAFLVQLLNIAGTGPIFGALMGVVFRSGGLSVDRIRIHPRRHSA